jgi:methyl-accepting chemotaxis protein
MKIYVGFAVPISILIGVGAFVYMQSERVMALAVQTRTQSAPYAGRAQEMKWNVAQVQRWTMEALAAGTTDRLQVTFSRSAEHAQAFRENVTQFRELYRGEGNAAGLAALDELEKKFAAYCELGQSAAKARVEQGPAEGGQTLEQLAVAANALTQAIDPLQTGQVAALNTALDDAANRCTWLKTGASLGAAVAVLFSSLIAVALARTITRPVKRVTTELTEGAHEVNAAAEQVAAAAQRLAQGASDQASSLEETSAALEQMAAMTRTTAENANKANELAATARKNADQSDQTMGQLRTAMGAINESASQISKIIKVIEEIAFQTNLLALNAAVEAARAGEHGKGFAVVAEEVRNLSQRASAAAKDTTDLIEGSVNRAKEGTSVAETAAAALQGIVGDVAQVADLLNSITQASSEQAQGVEQINLAVSQMDKVTQQNAAGAEESASAAQELSAQAHTVQAIVGDLEGLVSGQRGG